MPIAVMLLYIHKSMNKHIFEVNPKGVTHLGLGADRFERVMYEGKHKFSKNLKITNAPALKTWVKHSNPILK